jgi:hypothetical protein
MDQRERGHFLSTSLIIGNARPHELALVAC